MAAELSKAYDPQSIEGAWAELWVRENLFAPDPKSGKPPFVIVIPPPNVTGSLHMGHALNNTLQDILIRWKRMSGFDTLWVPGTDHGGIATQNVVEKLLKQEKKSRYDLGREKFLERMWQWRKESGDTILMQLRRLGCSLDWSRTRFTMDEVCSCAVNHAFIDLFKRGWIYRGKRMVNWCPRCQTALSDIEVEYEERKDKLYHLRYPILSGKKDGWQGVPLVVATTRPETMLGDTAVAVHPEDPRYEKIHGWWVQLPLVDKEIPVIADRTVDPKFGTGVVKVTPAHDPADFEMGERHRLEQVVVIGFDGKMTEASGKYKGLSREEARKKVMEDLESQGLVEKIEDYKHSVGTCYRCGTVIEPLVSDQWFLKVENMSKQAAQVTREGRVKIFPDQWTGPYLNWLDNLKDWCVSRQIWWGHRIPIWYCVKEEAALAAPGALAAAHPAARTACPPIASLEKPTACPQCGGGKLEQDPDVLDTWFSSGLWPFSVFRWPEQTEDLKKYFPTSVLVTGHEILYLWVARMVMFGLTFDPKAAGKSEEKLAFRQVFIHGIVRDKQGKKMSKSLGNVIDPLVMMEKYGTDALRFVLASQSVPGRDMQISDDTFVGARNFANKIWNVSRFVLMNLASANYQRHDRVLDESELADRWILSRYQQTVESVNRSLEDYNLAQASRTLYQFIWSEFCDWYVELSKIRLLSENGVENKLGKQAALGVCLEIIEGLLHLLHPLMPFITEEIWKNLQEVCPKSVKSPSLLVSQYPRLDPRFLDPVAEKEMELIMELVTQLRVIRSEMNVPPGKKIPLCIKTVDPAALALVRKHKAYVQHLGKIETLEIGGAVAKPQKSASSVVFSMELFVPLEGLIDFEKEKGRLQKEVNAVRLELENLEKRLSNPDFKTHAPEEEVRKAEERKVGSFQKLKRLQEHLAFIG